MKAKIKRKLASIEAKNSKLRQEEEELVSILQNEGVTPDEVKSFSMSLAVKLQRKITGESLTDSWKKLKGLE